MRFVSRFPEVVGFIGANTYGQLSKSTIRGVQKVWETEFGLINGVHYHMDKQPKENWPKLFPKLKSYENTITFNNGGLIFTGSLDNYSAWDGTELGWACLDETKDTKEIAVKEVIIQRLRFKGMWTDGKQLINHSQKGFNPFNPLYVFTSPAKVPWINEWFKLDQHYEEIESKIYSKTNYYSYNDGYRNVVISSAYHNAHNLPSNYIDNLLSDLQGSPNKVNMLVYGSPIAKSGGEFYNAFERSRHIRECKYDSEYPVHLSFDQNVKPYSTCLAFQIVPVEGVYQIRIIKEFCLSFSLPRNEILFINFSKSSLSKKTSKIFSFVLSIKSNTFCFASEVHIFNCEPVPI